MFHSTCSSSKYVSDANGSSSDSSDDLSVTTIEDPGLCGLLEDILGEDFRSSSDNNQAIAEADRVERCTRGIDGVCACSVLKPLVCEFCVKLREERLRETEANLLLGLRDELNGFSHLTQQSSIYHTKLFVDAMNMAELKVQRDTTLYSSFAPCFMSFLQSTTEETLEEEDFF